MASAYLDQVKGKRKYVKKAKYVTPKYFSSSSESEADSEVEQKLGPFQLKYVEDKVHAFLYDNKDPDFIFDIPEDNKNPLDEDNHIYKSLSTAVNYLTHKKVNGKFEQVKQVNGGSCTDYGEEYTHSLKKRMRDHVRSDKDVTLALKKQKCNRMKKDPSRNTKYQYNFSSTKLPESDAVKKVVFK